MMGMDVYRARTLCQCLTVYEVPPGWEPTKRNTFPSPAFPALSSPACSFSAPASSLFTSGRAPAKSQQLVTKCSTHPICSISSRAWVMMLAPVKQTMPAISMEYQRALGGQSQLRGGRGTLEKDVRGVRVGRREYLKQGRTKVGLSSVLRIFLCSYF